MEQITSRNNTIIKDTKKLFTSSKSRKENGLFPLEGARLCFDVLNSFYAIDTVLVTESLYNRYTSEVDELVKKADKSYFITEEISNKLSDTPNPQGIFVLCKMQNVSNDFTSGKIIALDNVQDPSNVGAIIRTAEALGIDGIITYNCCDIYNPKTLRASMGSMLRMNIIATNDLKATLQDMKNDGFNVYSTVPVSTAKSIKDMSFDNTVCVIGNEANGVEEEIKSISDCLITIPMLGRAESLNASVAASITMWEMMR